MNFSMDSYSLYSAILFNSLFFIQTGGLCQSADWSELIDLAWQVWESMGVDHTASDMSTSTVTLEIPADLAYYLKVACADSAGVWHQHWRDVADGKRSDLDAAACSSLSRKAWELWEVLHSQGV